MTTSSNPADPFNSRDIAVEIRSGGWTDEIGDAEALVLRAANRGLDMAPEADGACELAIVLADDGFVRELNRDYRGMDKPTNVLSFACEDDPGDVVAPGAPRMLGDIIVAFETSRREAAEQGLSFSDHLSHLIVHGILHLVGYDHETDDQAAEMERREVEILSRLGIDDPYRDEV